VADPASFANVKLLLLGNGSNGSTTFTDSSSGARAVTGYGSAQISTAWSKFGGASISFDGNGDYLTVADSADFDFGSGDWTIEFWYYRAEFGNGLRRLIGKRISTGGFEGPFSVQTDASNYIEVTFRNAGGTAYTINSGDIDLVLEELASYHIAIERSGNTFRLYVDGEVVGSVSFTGAVYSNSAAVCIGNNVAGLAGTTTAATGLKGNIDDLRITKGEALYNGSTFTPPTSELPVGSTTTQARVAAVGPLGAAALLAHGGMLARLVAAGPLGAGQLLAYARPVSLLSAPGPLGASRLTAEHDFTSIIEALGVVDFYTCELVDGSTLQVPISSWQGTQQTDGACYLQAVIPAVADLAAAINALTATAEFVIKRCARLPDGFIASVELARSVVEQVQLDRGPQRYTCTLSGYSAAITAPGGSGPPLRVLQGVRSISTGTSGTRTRCAINWLLRPGGSATAGDVPLVADYINYYVQGSDAYMDVGERV
jgi:hypothetical protein